MEFKMDSIKLFLSGSVQKKFKNTNSNCKYWETDDEEYLRKNLLFPCTLFNPNSLTVSFFSPEMRCKEDFRAILQSDYIIVDATDKRGIGVGAEMVLAKMHNIPIFTICSQGSHYKNVFSGCEWIHPLIFELSDKIFDSIVNLVDYLNEAFKLGKIYPKQQLDSEDILNRLYAFDAGYDEGYTAVKSFWGDTPARLVQYAANLLKQNVQHNINCLDLGCGHGKNAIYLQKQGFNVTAFDASYYSIKEAQTTCKSVAWKVRDIRKFTVEPQKYDLILLTGSLHCLTTRQEVEELIEKVKISTQSGGYNVISAFNSDEQDLSGHSKNFHPILLSHIDYLNMYSNWHIVESTNTILEDKHPHNNIRHKHSITRLLVQNL